MAKQITLRGVSVELARRLTKLAGQRRQSINTTVLELLDRATGINGRRERLARYTTWAPADVTELEEAVRVQRTIDRALWD